MRRPVLVFVVLIESAVASSVAAEASKAYADACRWKDLPHTNTVYKPKHYDTLDAWTARREWLREQVKVASGLVPEPIRAPIEVETVGTIERPECVIEKIWFESQPGVLVTGNLYRPRDVSVRRPAIACPHGHWPGGRINHEARGSVPARCITLARMGAVVFAYDMFGYNDSGETITFGHREEKLSSPANALWGIGQFQLQTYNSIRVLDYLQSLSYVDRNRIGVTGASGGGTQTFILCAVDDRVAVAAPVNMISSTMQGGCICENAPILRIGTENMEIGALFAPKPLKLISATGDWTKLTPEVEYPFIRSIYALYDATDKISHTQIDAEHNYNQASREAVYAWFARHLFGQADAKAVAEEPIDLPNPRELRLWTANDQPPIKLTYEELVQQLRKTIEDGVENIRPTLPRTHLPSRLNPTPMMRAVQATIRQAIGADVPAADETTARMIRESDESELWEFGRGCRHVRAMKYYPRMTPAEGVLPTLTIVVHPDGLDAVKQVKPLLDHELDIGNDVLLIEPFGVGQNKPPADASPARGTTEFFTTFNRTDHAEAVYDIMTVLGHCLRGTDEARIRLVGLGRMGPPTLAARSMLPYDLVEAKRLRTVIDLNELDINSDQAYLEQLFIPNIRRIGGLPALAAASVTGPCWFFNAHPKYRGDWAITQAGINRAQLRFSKDAAELDAIGEWMDNSR